MMLMLRIFQTVTESKLFCFVSLHHLLLTKNCCAPHRKQVQDKKKKTLTNSDLYFEKAVIFFHLICSLSGQRS